MAYEEMAMAESLPGGGAVGMDASMGGMPGMGGGMGGGPQDEVGALIEARAQIDARLEQLGVPLAMLNADAGGVPGGVPGGAPGGVPGGVPGGMAGPNMGMPPPMPPPGLLG